jgi:hypothetical protein
MWTLDELALTAKRKPRAPKNRPQATAPQARMMRRMPDAAPAAMTNGVPPASSPMSPCDARIDVVLHEYKALPNAHRSEDCSKPSMNVTVDVTPRSCRWSALLRVYVGLEAHSAAREAPSKSAAIAMSAAKRPTLAFPLPTIPSSCAALPIVATNAETANGAHAPSVATVHAIPAAKPSVTGVAFAMHDQQIPSVGLGDISGWRHPHVFPLRVQLASEVWASSIVPLRSKPSTGS